jgi:hypothetical protein
MEAALSRFHREAKATSSAAHAKGIIHRDIKSANKAYIAGTIGSLGCEYVLGSKAVNCQSGDTLHEEVSSGVPESQW